MEAERGDAGVPPVWALGIASATVEPHTGGTPVPPVFRWEHIVCILSKRWYHTINRRRDFAQLFDQARKPKMSRARFQTCSRFSAEIFNR